MISPTSVTDRYILQPSLINQHKKSLEWLSASVLWRRELVFFQKLLDTNAQKFTAADDKKKIGHFQSLITYYGGELIVTLTSRLRENEKELAEMLGTRDESKTEYFRKHETLMGELEMFNNQFQAYKEEFFKFMEKVM